MAAAILAPLPPAILQIRRRSRRPHHLARPPILAAFSVSFPTRSSQFRPPYMRWSPLCAEGQPLGADDGPVSVEMEPIASEAEFHRIVSEAAQLGRPLVVLWMAKWCRKCIYLKPKLEKLAADYHPRNRFYSVDVNSVPQTLVNYAGITKMPTIQLWRDGKKQAEVIGGYQAWLVVNDVCEMIENEP